MDEKQSSISSEMEDEEPTDDAPMNPDEEPTDDAPMILDEEPTEDAPMNPDEEPTEDALMNPDEEPSDELDDNSVYEEVLATYMDDLHKYTEFTTEFVNDEFLKCMFFFDFFTQCIDTNRLM